MKVYGKNVLKELENNPEKIKKAYISKGYKDDSVFSFLKDHKISFEIVDASRLNKMVDGNHQGIVLDVLEYDYYSLEDVIGEEMIVALDHLEDVHNFGAIIRTCEAAGIKSIIIPKDRSVSVNGTVMKTSSGALNYVKIVMVNNLVQTLKNLKGANYFIYAADMDGEDYRSISYADRRVLVIGNEGSGISRLVAETSDVIVSIPMSGHVNSLNASVAAGILIYGMRDAS